MHPSSFFGLKDGPNSTTIANAHAKSHCFSNHSSKSWKFWLGVGRGPASPPRRWRRRRRPLPDGASVLPVPASPPRRRRLCRRPLPGGTIVVVHPVAASPPQRQRCRRHPLPDATASTPPQCRRCLPDDGVTVAVPSPTASASFRYLAMVPAWTVTRVAHSQSSAPAGAATGPPCSHCTGPRASLWRLRPLRESPPLEQPRKGGVVVLK